MTDVQSVKDLFQDHYVTRIGEGPTYMKKNNIAVPTDFKRNIDTPAPDLSNLQSLKEFLDIILSDEPLERLPSLIASDDEDEDAALRSFGIPTSEDEWNRKQPTFEVKKKSGKLEDPEFDDALLQDSMQSPKKKRERVVSEIIGELELEKELVDMQKGSISKTTAADLLLRQSAEETSEQGSPESTTKRGNHTEESAHDDTIIDLDSALTKKPKTEADNVGHDDWGQLADSFLNPELKAEEKKNPTAETSEPVEPKKHKDSERGHGSNPPRRPHVESVEETKKKDETAGTEDDDWNLFE